MYAFETIFFAALLRITPVFSGTSACTVALPLQVATLSAGELTPVDFFTARLRHAVASAILISCSA
ncbi:MAG: hypothetical protein R3E79_25655 [Caldilineaceae bacterium]